MPPKPQRPSPKAAAAKRPKPPIEPPDTGNDMIITRSKKAIPQPTPDQIQNWKNLEIIRKNPTKIA